MKRSILAVLVTALMAAMALTVSPTATGQPQAGLPIPATCTDPSTGATVDCALTLIGFQQTGGTLNAVFLFVNEATGEATRVLVPVLQAPGETCTILELTIEPIDLFLLGLRLQTDTIHLVLTAERGTLLGDLLCGLFFGNSNLGNLLTGALRQGLITVQ